MPAKLVQIRRGTTLDHSVFIGKQGEITVDLDKDTLVVHDEQKQGGWPLAKESMANVIGKVGLAQLKINGTPIAEQFLQIDANGELVFSNIAPFAPDIAGTPVGGDLSGTVGNSEINSDTIGITELDVVDGIAGQYLTTNGAGVLSFTTDQNADVGGTAVGGDVTGVVSNIQLSPNVVTSNELQANSVGITELDVSSGIEGQLLAIDSSGNLEFITNDSISIDVGGTAVGGDVTGTVSNIQLSPNVVTSNELEANSVGITELDVSDGQTGDILTTDGSGVLSFVPIPVPSLPEGQIVNHKYVSLSGFHSASGYVTYSSGNINLPLITQGFEFMAMNYTPTDTNNTLRILTDVWGGAGSGGTQFVFTTWITDTVTQNVTLLNARGYQTAVSSNTGQVTMVGWHKPTTQNQLRISFRLGAVNGVQVHVNSTSSNDQDFGSNIVPRGESSISVQEYTGQNLGSNITSPGQTG
jgi:hypothetical protein